MAQEPHPRYLGGPDADPAAIASGDAHLHQSDLLKQQAKEAIKKGEFSKAVPLLEQALRVIDLSEPRILLADIYIRQGKTDDVLRTLWSMIYPDPHSDSDIGHNVTTRMKYVLALLNKNRWQEAVTVYEESFTGVQVTVFGGSKNGELPWQLPSDGPVHTVPEMHFSTEYTNYPALTAQAHLILGCRSPMFVESKDKAPYMIDHLQKALKSNRKLLDARFLIGVLLAKMERFTEARSTFEETARLAPKEAQPEIAAALKDLKVQEDKKLANDARHAALKASTTQQATPPITP